MKQKKARALDPEARWRLPCAASDLSEEFLEQMSEDAWDVYGTEEYSRLSDLFQDIDSWSDWDKDPIKEYLESMTNRAHQANALADAWVDGRFRWADAVLQGRCAKLIGELPDASLEKHKLTNESSAEKRWEAVARLVTQYIGEVRILRPEAATWTLCKVDHWDYLSEKWLVRQFQVQLDGRAKDFASSWLGHRAKNNLEAQVRDIASAKRIHRAALYPCWEKQIMRMVAPVTLPQDLRYPMDWRLDGAVTNIGELLLRLGHTQDSFAGLNCMKLHLQFHVLLVVRITKRHRNNWLGTEHTSPCCTPALSN
jgi:hypothetical protein